MEEVIKLLYLFKRYKNSETQNYLLDNFQANFQARSISAYFFRTTKKRTSWR